ncbi:SDR family NAD(P)-dependent oxidoreductase [Streptomyces muensis]|uniref:SDR family NAD(P)-dependent oxidoreductase n=1 Tax=Streptomyces muensis TaxID=1077944 RepID=UPI0027E2C0DA|nr:SDR family NAD(P)-dependent oxidoreductase [Streptomyces muensis]
MTGAASGLGRATARALVAENVRVFGLDLSGAADTVNELPGVTHVTADITRPDEIEDAVRLAAQAGPLRTVINCAGIAPTARIVGRDGIHDLDLFARVVSVNVLGTFNVMTLCARTMAENEPDEGGQRGIIVNTASIAAFDGQIGQAAYAASKGAIASLTLPAARDLASKGIRVCTIAPGIVDTPMMASFSAEVRQSLAAGVPFPPRLARPEEFAQLALAVIAHDYLNGEVIRMDGALRMGPR